MEDDDAIGKFYASFVNYYDEQGKPHYDYESEATISLLDEAKKEFPKKKFFDHPDPDNPEEAANDAKEFYQWFKKWFGEQK